ncbi:nicotinamide riboside transporter PnuC [Aquabacterium sp. A3]|uniref:nicotinamide riboside transporter PnuC n=1 Tax=Aquabacterium sp. A3 TaxID=3132829 RepID=UPI003119230E
MSLFDPWLVPWFHCLGAPVTRLEVVAVVLSLAMVAMNLRVNPWAWPLAIAASLLYGVLFEHYGLYGEASLQLVFVVASLWGWWQWLWGTDEQQQALRVRPLTRQGWAGGLLAWAVLWALTGWFLDRYTDSDVPYWDALPTAGSLVGQWWLARKWIDNWMVWLAVNLLSIGLFAYKQMWLTALLYAVFALLSVMGWLAWRRLHQQALSHQAAVV